MDMSRLEILQKIESGELSVEEGARLLNQLEAVQAVKAQASYAATADTAPDADPEVVATPAPVEGEFDQSTLPDFRGFKVWSWALFGLFTLITGISAWWMISSWQRHPFGWGFWLSWIPFLLGILGMVTSFNARWLHLRVTERENGEWKTFRLSFPLPLGIAVWALKSNPQWLPRGMRDKNLGVSLDELDKSFTPDQPFYLKVDEDDEHVEIFIG